MLILKRTYHSTHTQGTLTLPDGSELVTLERPDLNNKPFVSCIPEGIYTVSRNTTGRHRYYGLLDVPKRSAIEIHPVTRVEQLEGCIAPGYSIEEGVLYGSTKACKELLHWFGDNHWVLKVTS